MRRAWSVVPTMVLIAGLAAPAADQQRPDTRSHLQPAGCGGEQTEQKQGYLPGPIRLQIMPQVILARAKSDSLPKPGRWTSRPDDCIL